MNGTVTTDSQRVERDNVSDMDDESSRENGLVDFTEEELEVKERIKDILRSRKSADREWNVPALRKVPRSKLLGMTKAVGKVLEKVF